MSKYKIAIIGPESSGKSTLTSELSDHYYCDYVEEYSRPYLESLDRKYVFDDILKICQKQKEMEERAFRHADTLLICDSTALTCQVWCEDKFHRNHPEIDILVKKETYDLTFLCTPDLKWEADPMREDEKRRDYLFDVYKGLLTKLGKKYQIIEGTGEKRTKMAIKFVDQMLAEK